MARDDDLHTQWKQVYIVLITLCLTYTICIFLMRLWIRRNHYGLDDLVAVFATAFAIAHFIVEYIAISLDFGQSINELESSIHLASLNKINLVGIALFFISSWGSKGAAIVFLSRFAARGFGRHWKAVFATLGLVGLLGVACVIAMTAKCRSSPTDYYYNFAANSRSCPNQYARWQWATGFDVFTEILILILPIDLVLGLQMSAMKKFRLILAFSTRMPVIVFSLIHLHYLHNLKSTDDPGIASGSALTWQEVELTYSLAATTLITLKSFTREFDTGFGLGGEIFRTHGTNTVGYIGSSTSTASRTKQGVGENIKLEVRRGTSLQLQGIVADELAAAVNSNKRVSGSHGFKQIDSVLNGVGRTTTTVSHDPRGSLSTAQGDGRNEGDAIMVTHQVEQVIHPRHVV